MQTVTWLMRAEPSPGFPADVIAITVIDMPSLRAVLGWQLGADSVLVNSALVEDIGGAALNTGHGADEMAVAVTEALTARSWGIEGEPVAETFDDSTDISDQVEFMRNRVRKVRDTDVDVSV